MVKKTFPLPKVYGLLEPGPVVMVTTVRKGRPNIMTMSWHTMIEFEPPLVGCVISNRNYTFGILKATKECVINIPTVELAAQGGGVREHVRGKDRQIRGFWSHAGGRTSESRRRSSTNAMRISNARSSIRG
jgi:flavin reductase (DIM6/NTAB) family NADH-FMN oxidoreductase RutF